MPLYGKKCPILRLNSKKIRLNCINQGELLYALTKKLYCKMLLLVKNTFTLFVVCKIFIMFSN